MTYSIDGLYGGLFIGLAAMLLLLFNGRVAGISGIAKAAMSDFGQAWRYLFLVGLLLGAFIYQQLVGPIVIEMQVERSVLLVAGVLVGIGTGLGSGCTSGHGICGMARGSKRSIVATMTFMVVGILTVYIARHVV